MNDLLKWALILGGGYWAYSKFSGVGLSLPESPATPPATPATPRTPELPGPAAYGPQAGSELSGPALNLRNGLIAAWLGSQGKPWPEDNNPGNPSLSVTQWDTFMTGYISPGAKPVTGTQSVTADDYVKLRVTGNLGLSGLGARHYVQPRGRNLTPGVPRKRFFPTHNYVRAGTPMIHSSPSVLPRRAR
jgi:hypothetical protein